MSKGMFEKKGQHVYKTVGGKSLVLLLALVLLVGCMIGGTVAWLMDSTDKIENVFTTSDIEIELKEHDYVPETGTLDQDKEVKENKDYKMVPGWTIPKDPWVTVSDESEDCYLFIKVEGKNAEITKNDNGTYNLRNGAVNYVIFAIEDGWKQLTDDEGKEISGVYYKEIDDKDDQGNHATEKYNATSNNPVTHPILAGGTYTVDNVNYTWGKNEVLTNPEVTKDQMEAVKDNPPTLTFTAYAVQLYENNTDKFKVEDAWAKVASAPVNSGN